MSLADDAQYACASFFTYRIPRLDLLYWIFSELVLLGVNGVALLRFAFVQGDFDVPLGRGGTWSARVPVQHLRLFAINLVGISLLLLLFYLIRSASLFIAPL